MAYYGEVPPPTRGWPPTWALSNNFEIWIALSGDANWGGCQVWVSTDGTNYQSAGSQVSPARMGVLTASLATVTPAQTGLTIDGMNTLAVDLTTSRAQLTSGTQADALQAATLMYVGGEYMAYQTATLTSGYHYSLTYLNRGLYSTVPAFHPTNAPAVRLTPGSVYTFPLSSDRVGQTFYFKFLSVNQFGGGAQRLADVAAYPYTIQGTALAQAMPNVQNLRIAFLANYASLAWDEVSDFRTFLYEIRKGASWASAQTISRVAHPPFTISGDDTYWVAAVTTPEAGIIAYSAAPSSIVAFGTVLLSNLVTTYDEAATSWSGTLTSATIVLGDVLAAPNTVGLYEIPTGHQIDVGRAVACNVLISWQAAGQIVGSNILTVADFLGMTDVLGAAAISNTNIYPEIALSQNGTTWGAWQRFSPGAYTARKFKARMHVESIDAQTQALALAFTFGIDAPVRNDHYLALAIASGGTALVFKPDGAGSTAAFNGGPNGAIVPRVLGQILSSVAGDSLSVTAITLTGCTLQVLNGGVGVARSINLDVGGF